VISNKKPPAGFEPAGGLLSVYSNQKLLSPPSPAAGRRLEHNFWRGSYFNLPATISATSFTLTDSPSALAASVSITMQKGQPTASVPAASRLLAIRCAFCQKWRDNVKELSSATHVAETADGGLMPPRLVASPAAADLPPEGG
jgi:hypothetical protein